MNDIENVRDSNLLEILYCELEDQKRNGNATLILPSIALKALEKSQYAQESQQGQSYENILLIRFVYKNIPLQESSKQIHSIGSDIYWNFGNTIDDPVPYMYTSSSTSYSHYSWTPVLLPFSKEEERIPVTLEITVPRGFTAISSGSLISVYDAIGTLASDPHKFIAGNGMQNFIFIE